MPDVPATSQRLFVDQAVIHVRGGRGGDGCVSFRREKFAPKGGPDGGDGGNGGSVYMIAKAGVDTLLDLTGRHHYHAENGRPGEGANCSGKGGEDLDVLVPVGTLVFDADSGRLLKDMVQDEQRICVGQGGRGGRGNAYFVSSTNQAPRNYQPGQAGVERTLRLELKLIADVGFVGLPNAGKSALLARLTNARPKIAAYPFTTKNAQLGIAELSGFRRLVLADIPGLIEGAHEGAGMGDAFLRHIERTRLIVHLIDLCPPVGSPTPDEAYGIIRKELEKYSPRLAERDEIIVGAKTDLTDADLSLELLQEALGRQIHSISAVTGAGVPELLQMMWERVQVARSMAQAEASEPTRVDLGSDFEWSTDADSATRNASDAGTRLPDPEPSAFEWNPDPEPRP